MKCLKHHAQRLATGLLLGLTLFVGIIATPQVFAYQQISAGDSYTCALKNNGGIVCWGDQFFDQTLAPSGFFTQISSGKSHSCASKSDGSLACWGWNKFGQATPPLGAFTQISAGGGHTCVLKNDGSIACWGAGTTNAGNNLEYGQSVEYGQSLPPSGTFKQVSAGSGTTSCAVKTDGTIACWGQNDRGQASPPTGTFTQVSVGVFHACAIKTDGTAICWGSNSNGQTAVPSGKFSQIGAGWLHTCALKVDGTVVCWGDEPSSPTGVFAQLSVGHGHSCALKADGSATCWGFGMSGETTVPVEINDYVLTTAKVGNGKVSNGGSFVTGATVNLTATPDADYKFMGWNPSTCKDSFVMPAQNLTCTATFEKIVDTTPLPVVSQCATYNLFAQPMVAFPCVNVGGTVYKAGMNLISNTPTMRFEVDMSNLQPSNLIPNEQCAVFPAPNTLDHLRINCLDLGDKYWVDLKLVNGANAIQFDLVNFAKN